MIEAGAIDVIGVILVNAEIGNFPKAERAVLSVGPVRPVGAVLADEPGFFHRRQEADFVEEPHGRADERFADVRPRMDGFFQDQMIDARLGEIRAERRTGWTAADDDDIGIERDCRRGFGTRDTIGRRNGFRFHRRRPFADFQAHAHRGEDAIASMEVTGRMNAEVEEVHAAPNSWSM